MTITVPVILTEINCGCCGGTYAINERYREKTYEAGGYWNCPYCKTSWGYGESEADRLRKVLAKEESRHAQTRAERDELGRKLNANKSLLSRERNRVKNGVCPCCNRTFTDLQRHMKSKHPDFAEKS